MPRRPSWQFSTPRGLTGVAPSPGNPCSTSIDLSRKARTVGAALRRIPRTLRLRRRIDPPPTYESVRSRPRFRPTPAARVPWSGFPVGYAMSGVLRTWSAAMKRNAEGRVRGTTAPQPRGDLAGAQAMTSGMAAVQQRSAAKVAVLGHSGTVAIGHTLQTTSGNVHRAPDGPGCTAAVHSLRRTDPFTKGIA